MKRTVAQDFDKAYRKQRNGCWIWRRARAGKEAKRGGGYGCFRVRGKLLRAHAYAWERANGQIPAGLQVMHLCNDTRCVNPKHLDVGTNADNQRERSLSGGARKKLTLGKVRRIRALCKGGMSQKRAGEMFGVCNQTVWEIVHRRIWRHFD